MLVGAGCAGIAFTVIVTFTERGGKTHYSVLWASLRASYNALRKRCRGCPLLHIVRRQGQHDEC
jgi:hypothetical protein